MEGRIGVPEDVVGSWAPQDGDVRHWGEPGRGNRWWQNANVETVQEVGGVG